MRSLWFIIIVVLLGSASCSDPFPGFSRIDDGLYFRIRSFTDDTLKPAPGDMVRFEIKMDDMLGQELDRRFLIAYDPDADGFQSEFHRFHIGDSISLIFSSERMREEFDLRLPIGQEHHRIEMVMRDVIPRRRWEIDRAVALRIEKEKEDLAIASFLQTSDTDYRPLGDLLIAKESALMPEPVEADVPLYVYYVSRLLDGRPVEVNVGRDDYLSYRLGMQGQLIDGLATAISKADYDTPMDVIIPFSEAFGERGVPGIVPPYSTLRYTVLVRREPMEFEVEF